jgi:hypothetical protein
MRPKSHDNFITRGDRGVLQRAIALEGALELASIELLHVIEHGWLGRNQVLPELVVLRRLLAASAALASQRLTRRHDAHPAAQVTAPGEVDDLRVSAVADEHAVPDLLLDLGDHVAIDPDPAQSAIELAEAALVEHGDRVGVAVCAGAGEVEIRRVHPAQRDRRRKVRRQALAQIRNGSSTTARSTT